MTFEAKHMIEPTQSAETNQPSSSRSDAQVKKYLKLAEVNYRCNTESSYTEKIQQLGKDFNYSSNSDRYWREPALF